MMYNVHCSPEDGCWLHDDLAGVERAVRQVEAVLGCGGAVRGGRVEQEAAARVAGQRPHALLVPGEHQARYQPSARNTGCPAKLFTLGYLLFCGLLLMQIAKVGTFLKNSGNLLHDRHKNFENRFRNS